MGVKNDRGRPRNTVERRSTNFPLDEQTHKSLNSLKDTYGMSKNQIVEAAIAMAEDKQTDFSVYIKLQRMKG